MNAPTISEHDCTHAINDLSVALTAALSYDHEAVCIHLAYGFESLGVPAFDALTTDDRSTIRIQDEIVETMAHVRLVRRQPDLMNEETRKRFRFAQYAMGFAFSVAQQLGRTPAKAA